MIEIVISEFEDTKKKTIESLERSLNKMRTGRASLSLLDGLRIDYYGVPTPLKQVASISTPEARLIIIQPWEQNLCSVIEKEILKSDIGINPNNDGKLIRLNVPPLTDERRKDLIKVINKNGEEARIALRNQRRNANKEIDELEKSKDISEDEMHKAIEDIKNLLDRSIEEVDRKIEAKVKEVQEV